MSGENSITSIKDACPELLDSLNSTNSFLIKVNASYIISQLSSTSTLGAMATYSSNIVNAMEKGHADTTQLPESPTLVCRSNSWVSYLKYSLTTISSNVAEKSSVLSSPLQNLWRPSKGKDSGGKGKAVRGPVIVQKCKSRACF